MGPYRAHQLCSVIPAKAGIQYSAASPGLLDRPLSRAMTRLCDFIGTKFALERVSVRSNHTCSVMAGLVPAIPIIFAVKRDPRDKPAGDAGKWASC